MEAPTSPATEHHEMDESQSATAPESGAGGVAGATTQAKIPTVSATREDGAETTPRDDMDKPVSPPPEEVNATNPSMTLEAALAALNKKFAAFLVAQLTRHPSADFSKIAMGYIQHVLKIRAHFASQPQSQQQQQQQAQQQQAQQQQQQQQAQQQLRPPVPRTPAGSAAAAAAPRPTDVPIGGAVSPPTEGASDVEVPAKQDTTDESSGFSGFLASANAMGSASIWKDPGLLQLKTDTSAIQPQDAVYSSPRSYVWRGVWLATTPVALKRLAPQRQDLANALVLATNLKAVASLNHPRIVGLVGVEWTKVTDIQAMTEYVPRGDLRSLLDSVQLDATLSWANFKCQVAIDVVDALVFIHSRTIRLPILMLPSSRKVLLTDDARAKLNVIHGADLAQQRHSNAVRYMAPEVIMGGPASNAADMYAFGVLLCELDTTQPPYVDAVSPDGVKMEDELVAQQVVKGLLVPRASPQCPEEIRRVIAECTTPDPALRPTAAALAYTLREMLKNDM